MQPILFYGLSSCIHCRNAKEFFDSNDVSYDLVYVDTLQGKERDDTVETVKKYNPDLSFPTLVIGDKVVVGFNRQAILEALGRPS